MVTLSPFRSPLFIARAFLLRPIDGFGHRENALAFIPFAGSAPLQDNRREAGMLPGTPRQGRVAARQEIEVVKVSAGETQRAARLLEGHECTVHQLAAAFSTFRVTANNEHQKVVGSVFGHRSTKTRLYRPGSAVARPLLWVTLQRSA